MMTSRERVMAAVERQETDRVPARFNAGSDVSSRRVAESLGIPAGPCWFETLLRQLQIDIRNIDTVPVEGEYSGDTLNLAEAETAQDVDRCWPVKWRPENRSIVHAVDQVAAWDRDGVEPAVMLRLPALFGMVNRMRGDTRSFMDLADGNEVLLSILDRMEAFNAAMIEHAFDVLGERLDLVYLGEEIGMQTGLMFSPATIRAHFLPRIARLASCIHAGGAKVFFHSCGAITPLIPELIDAGVDVLNPIQPRVPGMEAEELAAADWRESLCLCGGMDMQQLMPNGTPAEIEADVARIIRCLAPGYILDLANILHPDIPPCNVLALYQTPRTGLQYKRFRR